MGDYRSNRKPISTNERLLAILEEIEEQQVVLEAILKELKKGSKTTAPLAATKTAAKTKGK